LVRESARRRGIRLEWIRHQRAGEAALDNRQVDLWPLMTITPERKKRFHFSEAYLEHGFFFLVRQDAPYRSVEDLEQRTLSHLDQPIVTHIAKEHFPRMRLVARPTVREAVAEVCESRVDGAFFEENSVLTTLLDGLPCAGVPMRMIWVPTVHTSLGVAATFEAARAADEIREEIGTIAKEGKLPSMASRWGDFSVRNTETIHSLREARQRERNLIGAIIVFGCLFLLALWQTIRRGREAKRAWRAEQTLRETDQKLRLMANNLSEMVLAYDMDRRLVFANAAVERLTGYSATDLQKENFICWIHPDDRFRMLGYWDKLFHEGGYDDQEYRIVTKDGQTKWAAATWGPIYDDTGRQVGVRGSERDITDSKRASQALRESERRFRELLEGVQLFAIVIDLGGMIGFCNDRTLAITGWGREEVVGRPASQFLGAEFLRQLTDQAAVSESACPRVSFFEASMFTKNGGRRSIQCSSTRLRDSTGRASGFAVVGADVTELRTLQADAARREGEERFRNLADTAPLMIWVAGPDQGCTFANRGWLSFTGRTLEQELGGGWTTSIHPDDMECCFKTYGSAFDDRRAFQLEYRLRRADGEFRWVLGGGVPRFGPDGEFAGYIGNCTDITDLKRSQEQHVVRQKLESVGRLAGGIAHDFNNLLGAVLAQADLALSELADGSSPDEPLNRIRNVAIRGAGIVRQLMIYAGHEDAVSEPVDLSSLIVEMMELLNVVVSKHAVLETELGGGLPSVQANPAQLRQLVMNLVTNASEAIGERDGVITIRTARARAGSELPSGGGSEFVQLDVSDTGCGMTLEAQARIFDPFFTTKPAGHGLGLSVVQGIVRGLGGTIQLESDPGRGTTFHILLRSAGQPAPAPGPANPSLAPEELKHAGIVLVVEDEAPLRIAITKVLHKRGFDVLEAADGTAALKLIHEYEGTIAVLLLDITLPGAPSREVLAEARGVRPDIKVIVTSAYGQNQVDESFPGMKIDSFIRKPFQLANLLSQIRIVMSE
jgi:PAS domain S-box-containing protein